MIEDDDTILVVRMTDAEGRPAANVTLELHSTPKTAQTNKNGVAIFTKVESGWHTLYTKDQNGNVQASGTFEIVYGDGTALNGNRLIVKKGGICTISIQIDGSDLRILSQEEGDIYKVLSPRTGDPARLLLWLVLAIISLGGGIYLYGKKKKLF